MCVLHDAMRHSPECSTIQIDLAASDATVTFRILDQGPSIPVSASARIFDRFVKLDEARSRDKSGSGLGPAITRWIMRMHQGDVLYELGDVRGAVFSLNLRRSLVAGRGQV